MATLQRRFNAREDSSATFPTTDKDGINCGSTISVVGRRNVCVECLCGLLLPHLRESHKMTNHSPPQAPQDSIEDERYVRDTVDVSLVGVTVASGGSVAPAAVGWVAHKNVVAKTTRQRAFIADNMLFCGRIKNQREKSRP